ncbi:bim1p [Saccharomyces arboricola H-6]|uniref:Bim1p n=1 Tax=Saccharomyces arboricola (strain H-6 / AS 2.3317 / CBS 10644) TaxID=1160507 RepID=J8Q5W7_SACAR|nr:bim1p [Saccharomyces arboricola H-6]
MSAGIGESRTELLTWLNGLLNLNYKKIEECGTGAAYCQIMDSIYGDLPMNRVKFNASAEYEFQTNYKILQSCFSRHGVEKTVYVDKLIRCKFQDNLEFLQWLKKHWIRHKDESAYDPDARRKYRPIMTNNSAIKTRTASNPTSTRRSSSTGTGSTIAGGLPARHSSLGVNTSRKTSVPQGQLVAIQSELSKAQETIGSLNEEIEQYKGTVSTLEIEREFYFNKLRDIEILVHTTQDLINEGVYKFDDETITGRGNANGGALLRFVKKVESILYATAEGFEMNDGGGEPDHRDAGEYGIVPNESGYENMNGNGNEDDNRDVIMQNNGSEVGVNNNLIIDEETF